MPWAIKSLEEVPMSLDGLHNEFRSGLLGCIKVVVFGYGEPLRPFLDGLVPVLLKTLQEDVDENAADSMQAFIDLNKFFRWALEQWVPIFLDFVLELMSNFACIARDIMEEARRGEHGTKKWACASFKLLHDSPVMVVLILQLHRRFINEYVGRFVPVVVQLLQSDEARPSSLLPPIQSIEQIGEEPTNPLRSAFNDFIACQIKVSRMPYIKSNC